MERPELPIATAIEQFNISRSTLRRRIANGEIQGARQLEDGKWLVPVDGIIAAGIPPRKTWLDETNQSIGQVTGQSAQSGQVSLSNELEYRVKELEFELQLERQKREAAEELKRSSDQLVEALQHTLRMIAPARETHSQPEPTADFPVSDKKSSGFWSRLFGSK